MPKPLKQNQFHSIRRDIIAYTGGRPATLTPISKATIAKTWDVSVETVRVVQLTKTWPGFQLYKKQQQEKAAASRRAKAAAAKRALAREEAEKANLLSRPVLKSNIFEVPVANRSLAAQELTRSQRAEANRRAFHKLDAMADGKSLEDRVLDLEVEVERLKARQPRTFWERIAGRSY
jgi:hypothetical protein